MAGVANYLNCLPYFFRYYFQNTRKERILFFHHIIIKAFRKEFGCTVYDKSCNHPHFPWTSWLPKVTITLFMSLLICPAMQLNQGGEYAFHSLFYMVDMPVRSTIGIKELAELNKLSETYLSKIFTKLRKAGIVRSSQGGKGRV